MSRETEKVICEWQWYCRAGSPAKLTDMIEVNFVIEPPLVPFRTMTSLFCSEVDEKDCYLACKKAAFLGQICCSLLAMWAASKLAW